MVITTPMKTITDGNAAMDMSIVCTKIAMDVRRDGLREGKQDGETAVYLLARVGSMVAKLTLTRDVLTTIIGMRLDESSFGAQLLKSMAASSFTKLPSREIKIRTRAD